MDYTLEDIINGLTTSRQMFLKHIANLRDDQWDWQPYPQCMSIRQTLQHLITDDRAALQSLQTGHEPTYKSLRPAEQEIDRLLELMEESHQQLISYLREHYANAPLDTEICVWGWKMKLPQGIAYFSSEDFYHMGQVAFIRQASDPEWDYYEAIYGVSSI